MRIIVPASLALATLVGGCMSDGGARPAAGGSAAAAPGAVAELRDGSGAPRGNARFTQTAEGVRLEVQAVGFAGPAGPHGIHIHTTGQCVGPDFATAGGHWNPTEHKHGTENPAGPHMGDMPNIDIAADGSGTFSGLLKGARLTGGSNPILDADGAALIIHAGPDDYKTDPSGNSGGRLACGVVTPA